MVLENSIYINIIIPTRQDHTKCILSVGIEHAVHIMYFKLGATRAQILTVNGMKDSMGVAKMVLTFFHTLRNHNGGGGSLAVMFLYNVVAND